MLNRPLNYALLISVIFFTTLLTATLSETPKLIFVQEVFRHGHRYPIRTLPVDGSSFAEEIDSMGELTKQGKSMHYILGQSLYHTYWEQLFGGSPYYATYNQSKFYARSTNYNRTIESLQSQLQGIFQNLDTLTLTQRDVPFSLPQWPNADRQPGNVYTNAPKFHPVPIHVENLYLSPKDNEDFLLVSQICPNQDVWQIENLERAEVKAILADESFQSAIKQASAAVNANITSSTLFRYYDNYISLLYDGRKVNPIWTTPGPTRDALDVLFSLDSILKYYYTEQQLAATTTGYFNETYHHFKRIQEDQSGVQWAFYSAHDTTVGNFLARLNLTNARCIYDNYKKGILKNNQSKTCIVQYPAYTSNLIFEVYQYANATTTFKIRYNGEERGIPFCNWQLECRVESFYRWFQSWQDPNYVKTCGISDESDASTAFSIAVIEAGVILCFAIAFLYRHLQGRQNRDDEKLLSHTEKETEEEAMNREEGGRSRLADESMVTDR